MDLAQKMEAEARLNLETEIDAGDAEDVKLCIRMQTPKFVTKVRRAKRIVPGYGIHATYKEKLIWDFK